MVGAAEPGAGHSLPSAAVLSLLQIDCHVLSKDVIDSASTSRVCVPVGLGDILHPEGAPATNLPGKQILHDGVAHVEVQVAHPHHRSVRILLIHLFQVVVQLAELALVQPIAPSTAITQVSASSDQDLARSPILQDNPIGRTLPALRAAARRGHTSLQSIPLLVVVEDVRAIALPTIATWLRLEPLANRRREGSCHFTHGRGQFAQTDDVRFLFLGDGFGDGSRVLVLVIHIPLQDVCLYLSSRNSHGSLRKSRPR
mmetsp:Transcript_10503/g.32872  ORF Transcript_10503/g.32872 Transcript_10503/m.32872 type:complete len:256 (-) Transcript_10503:420-1187(-)